MSLGTLLLIALERKQQSRATTHLRFGHCSTTKDHHVGDTARKNEKEPHSLLSYIITQHEEKHNHAHSINHVCALRVWCTPGTNSLRSLRTRRNQSTSYQYELVADEPADTPVVFSWRAPNCNQPPMNKANASQRYYSVFFGLKRRARELSERTEERERERQSRKPNK